MMGDAGEVATASSGGVGTGTVVFIALGAALVGAGLASILTRSGRGPRVATPPPRP